MRVSSAAEGVADRIPIMMKSGSVWKLNIVLGRDNRWGTDVAGGWPAGQVGMAWHKYVYVGGHFSWKIGRICLVHERRVRFRN